MRTTILPLFMLAVAILPASAALGQYCLWANSAGGTSEATSVATDASGNVYVTGSFSGNAITFGATTLTNDTTIGSADIYLVKYNASGSVVWAKRAGGIADDYPNSVATDHFGNVYVTGNFISPTLTFGATTLTNTGFISGTAAIFLVKYDTAGNVSWARGASDSNYYDESNSVATDMAGNVYITGYFGGHLAFGATSLSDTGLGSYDIFLTKYDSSGNALWAKRAGGVYNDQAYAVTTDAYGHLYITGFFGSPSVTFGTSTVTNTGAGSDIFIVKYDTSGNAIWAKGSAGTELDIARSVATDSGNVYITGVFASPAISFGATTLTNAGGGNDDVFLVKYDTSGVEQWARSAGGLNNDEGNSVTTDDSGRVYVAGYYGSPTITFDTAMLTNAGSAGSFDIFLVKYNASGNELWARSAGGTGYEEGYSVAADATCNVYVTGAFASSSITFDTVTVSIVGSTDMYLAKYGYAATPTTMIASPAGHAAIEDISIYPNPAKDEITVSAKQGITTLTIYNLIGQAVSSYQYNHALQTQIDVSPLATGVYFIKVNGTEIGKLLKN